MATCIHRAVASIQGLTEILPLHLEICTMSSTEAAYTINVTHRFLKTKVKNFIQYIDSL